MLNKLSRITNNLGLTNPLTTTKRMIGFFSISLLLGSFVYFFYPLYHEFKSGILIWHDMGLLLHTLHNLFHVGQFLQYIDTSIQSFQTAHFFRAHFAPFFYILSPAVVLMGKLLANDLLGFIVIQVLGSALGVYSFFLLANKTIKDATASFVLSLCMMFFPYYMSINSTYHWEVFIFPLMNFLALSILSGKFIHSIVLNILVLSLKEDCFIYAIFCNLLYINRENYKLCGTNILISLAYKIFILNLFRHAYFPPFHEISDFYDAYGKSLFDVLKYLLLKPDQILTNIVNGDGIYVLMATSLIGIFHPRYILPLGILLIWCISSDPLRSRLIYYYSYGFLSLHFITLPTAAANSARIISAVFGIIECLINKATTLIRRPRSSFASAQTPVPTAFAPCIFIYETLNKTRPRYLAPLRSWLLRGVSVSLLCATIYWSLNPPEPIRSFASYASLMEAKPIPNLADHRYIQKNYLNTKGSILTQFGLAPYLQQRGEIYLLMYSIDSFYQKKIEPEYIYLDLESRSMLSVDQIRQLIESLASDDRYKKIFEKNGIHLYMKNPQYLSKRYIEIQR